MFYDLIPAVVPILALWYALMMGDSIFDAIGTASIWWLIARFFQWGLEGFPKIYI